MSERVNLASVNPEIVNTLKLKFAEIDSNLKPVELNK